RRRRVERRRPSDRPCDARADRGAREHRAARAGLLMAGALHVLKGGDAALALATIERQRAAGDRVTVVLLPGAVVPPLPAGPAVRRTGRRSGGWRPCSRPSTSPAGNALAIAVLIEPRHLNRLEQLLVARLGIVAEFRQLHHTAMQVGEPHGKGIRLGKLLAERDADVLCVAPRHHLGISTTTSPRTTAWQPSREWIVSPSAVSSRSSSSSAISDRFSSPSFTTT